MFNEYTNIAKVFESHMEEIREALGSFAENQLLPTAEDKIVLSKKQCVCQEFHDKIEIPNLKCVTSYDVSHCGVKEVCMHGEKMISVHYCISIKYIDNCCFERVVTKNGYVLFVDLPDCFRLDDFVVFIPNQLEIKTCCDHVIASGVVRLCCRCNCHHKCCDHQEWNEWSQHPKPCRCKCCKCCKCCKYRDD